MSIASCTAEHPKVCKTLMCSCTECLVPLRSLRTLKRVAGLFFYRHAGPNGPEEGFYLRFGAVGNRAYQCSSCGVSG